MEGYWFLMLLFAFVILFIITVTFWDDLKDG
jgi:hypothetical protein